MHQHYAIRTSLLSTLLHFGVLISPADDAGMSNSSSLGLVDSGI